LTDWRKLWRNCWYCYT